MEKLPKELLSEDKNTRVSVAYEAETAVMKGKFQKKEHRKQMGVFFSKGNSIEWNVSTGLVQVYALRFKYMNTRGKPIPVLITELPDPSRFSFTWISVSFVFRCI